MSDKKNIENISESKVAEKVLFNHLTEKGYYKKYPDLKQKYIGKGILITYRQDNIKVYYKFENGKLESLFNLGEVRKDHDFNKVVKVMGYKEIDENGILNLYSLKDIDENTGKPKPGIKPIDKFSNKYFEIWNNIIFYEDKIGIEMFKKPSIELDYGNLSEGQLKAYKESGSLRIKDLVYYYDDKITYYDKDSGKTLKKPRQITKKMFDKFLPKLQKLLLSQITDDRFDPVRDPVTEDEIKTYLQAGLITKELARDCYWKIKERDRIKEEKARKKHEIHSEAQVGIKDIQVG